MYRLNNSFGMQIDHLKFTTLCCVNYPDLINLLIENHLVNIYHVYPRLMDFQSNRAQIYPMSISMMKLVLWFQCICKQLTSTMSDSTLFPKKKSGYFSWCRWLSHPDPRSCQLMGCRRVIIMAHLTGVFLLPNCIQLDMSKIIHYTPRQRRV